MASRTTGWRTGHAGRNAGNELRRFSGREQDTVTDVNVGACETMNDQQKPSRGKTVHTLVFVLAMVVLGSIISYAALTFWAMHPLSEDNATMSTAMTVGGIVTGFVLFAQSALGKYFDMTMKLLNIAPDASSVTTTANAELGGLTGCHTGGVNGTAAGNGTATGASTTGESLTED